MPIDAEGHLSKVERAVAYLERDGQAASAVTVARSFKTTIEDVWDAVTRGERIPRWFAPVTGDLELGGRYQVEGNASGTVTACEPPSRFSLTWEFMGDVSWVDVELAEDGAGSVRLALTHTAIVSPFWDDYGAGAAGVGWEMGFMGLAMHIADPEVAMPDEMEFVTTPEGRAFISGSSQGWGTASIAAGTDPGGAHAAVVRTTAFYMGESAEPA